jgi:hypothetical protein
VREEFVPAISQIDGKSTRNTRRSDPIEPGKHVDHGALRDGPRRPGLERGGAEGRDEPGGCTRYRVVAHRKDSVNWEPKVYSEPIANARRNSPPRSKGIP